MCLYPRLVRNPKYIPNKKNGGHPPKVSDPRLLTVAIGCGKCIECRKQKANNWKIRLMEELKEDSKCYFITLTFSEKSLQTLAEYHAEKNEGAAGEDNDLATIGVRRFLERWRKKYTKSVKHWLITERGHAGTERIHLHGIIWCDENQIKELDKIWSYGWIFIGDYVNNKTINYIVKYVTKVDNNHKDFEGKILCSEGIGKHYISKKINRKTGEITFIGRGSKYNAFKGDKTQEAYRTDQGAKIRLPIYYRNKIYSEKEREILWLQTLDKGKRYITGTEYDFKTENDKILYLKALQQAQKDNIKNGYGSISWDIENYCKHELINIKTLKNVKKS